MKYQKTFLGFGYNKILAKCINVTTIGGTPKIVVTIAKGTRVCHFDARLAYDGIHLYDADKPIYFISKPSPKVPKGYTAEELDRDNPYNSWMCD